nr:hypothetical protein [Tanacetum cinerariifolium]
EPASPVRDNNQGEACPTNSGFIADQDRATIAKSSTLPRDSAPRVTSLAAEEGSMQLTINELTAFCTSLQRQHSELLAKFQAQEVEINRLKERVKLLEDKEGVIGDKSRDDAPIKGRSTNEGEAAAERIRKEVMVESDTPKKKKLQEQIDVQVASELEKQQEREDMRMNEQIARDAEVARIHAEEEIQVTRRKGKEVMVESETPKKQKVQEQIDAQVARELEEQLEKEDQRMVEQIARDKSSEEITEEAKSPEEVTEKKVKEIMHLVPIEEVYVEALQVKHPIIDRKVHSEGQRSYWKITRLGGSSACYQFFIDLIKHLDRKDLNQLCRLVKETHSTRPPTSNKEMELWVELSRLYEPDEADQLQRQRNIYACEEGLPSEEGSSTCDDLL